MKTTKTPRTRNVKAQVTMFIIIGLVILLVAALGYYLYRTIYLQKPIIPEEVLSDEAKPIESYITNCISDVAAEGFAQVGRQGGYLNVTGMRLNPVSYRSDALLFAPDTIPYWYYVTTCPQSTVGCVKTKQPPLCQPNRDCVIPGSVGANSIQENLDTYIESRLPGCIDNFKPFKDQFVITEGIPQADVVISQQDVQVSVNYPVSVTTRANGHTQQRHSFSTTLPINFKQVYEFASEVTRVESQGNFLERTTMNLITIFSGIDNQLLPPVTGVTTFTSAKKMWILQDVKQKLQDEVLPYVSDIQFLNAKNYQPIDSIYTGQDSVYADAIYKGMDISLSNKTYNVEANVIYPYSDIYLRVGDGSQIIQPKTVDDGGNIVLKLIGFNLADYRFKYDIQYPVIVEVRDPAAFNGKGYTFQFAMEATVLANQPFNQNLTPETIVGTHTLDINDDLYRAARNITFITTDRHTHLPLAGVRISYECGGTYEIGDTSLNAEGTAATLTSRMPFCQLGGRIHAEEPESHLSVALDYNNDDTDVNDVTYTFALWPLATKNVTLYKRTPQNLYNIATHGVGAVALYNTERTVVGENESASISVTRTPDFDNQESVPAVGFALIQNGSVPVEVPDANAQKAQLDQFLAQGLINQSVYDSMAQAIANAPQINASGPLPELTRELDFVPGTYEIDISLITANPVYIPAKHDTVCAGLDTFLGCIGSTKDVDYPAQSFSNWLLGGAKYNMTMTEADVYNGKDIIYYALEQPTPHTWDEMKSYQTPDSYQVGKEPLVAPHYE